MEIDGFLDDVDSEDDKSDIESADESAIESGGDESSDQGPSSSVSSIQFPMIYNPMTRTMSTFPDSSFVPLFYLRIDQNLQSDSQHSTTAYL